MDSAADMSVAKAADGTFGEAPLSSEGTSKSPMDTQPLGSSEASLKGNIEVTPMEASCSSLEGHSDADRDYGTESSQRDISAPPLQPIEHYDVQTRNR